MTTSARDTKLDQVSQRDERTVASPCAERKYITSRYGIDHASTRLTAFDADTVAIVADKVTR